MYAEDPLQFNRCIEFILLKYKIKSVRLHLCDNKYSTCPSISGSLVSDGDIKKEYYRISDWYNDVMGTHHSPTSTTYFGDIYISKKITLQFVMVKMVTAEDLREFTDHKYRSYVLYKQIHMLLRELKHIRSWNPHAVYKVAWNNKEYNVRINNTTTVRNTDTSNVMLEQFIKGTIKDLYHITPTVRIPIPNVSTDIHFPKRLHNNRRVSVSESVEDNKGSASESVEDDTGSAAESAEDDTRSAAESVIESATSERPYVTVDMGILVQHIQASGAFVLTEDHNALKASLEVATQEIAILKEQVKNLQAHVDAQGRYLTMFNEYTMRSQQQQQQPQYYVTPQYIQVPQNYTI